MELWLEPLAVTAFAILLVACVWMSIQFYVCDNQTCKVFEDAKKKSQPGTKEYTLELLNNMFGDSIWCFAFIGGSIISFICVWLLGARPNLKNLAIMLLVSFIVMYSIFAFIIHHYVKYIVNDVSEYVSQSNPKFDYSCKCPKCTEILSNTPFDTKSSTVVSDIKSLSSNKSLTNEKSNQSKNNSSGSSKFSETSNFESSLSLIDRCADYRPKNKYKELPKHKPKPKPKCDKYECKDECKDDCDESSSSCDDSSCNEYSDSEPEYDACVQEAINQSEIASSDAPSTDQ